jgi:uncharacterized membrane protein YhaH (DUF805 family)
LSFPNCSYSVTFAAEPLGDVMSVNAQGATLGAQTMSWTTLLFSFRGRINRAKYWAANLAVWVTMVVIVVLVIYAIAGRITGGGTITDDQMAGTGALIWLAFPLLILTIWISFALAVKRLHDREKSGWFIVPMYLIPGMLGRWADGFPPGSGGPYFLGIIAFGLTLWAFVELGCLAGTSGPNEYGPDPLGIRIG